MRRSFVAAVVVVGCTTLVAPLAGQTIPIRTVPVASGDQFTLTPSGSLSMGNVRLAVDDSLADPWSNPAKGALVTESAFLGSPTFYSISSGGGGGRSFPVTALFRDTGWFGGASLALQQIDNGRGRGGVLFAVDARTALDCCCCFPSTRTLSETYGRNLYASGYAGRDVGSGWSVALGASLAQIGAMDGVDLLYAGAEAIDQSGHLDDVRVGAYRVGSRDRVSVVGFRSTVAMKHEVTYLDWIWNDVLMQSVTQRRVEANHDETRTWGGEVEWSRDLRATGWTIGASGTINHKDHPKLPNYTIQNIPRDPGTTWAYEAAVGLAKTQSGTTFALDMALQPIWSETWQEADAQDVANSGMRLRVGDRSVENAFFFTNVIVRTGLSHRVERFDLRGGLEIRSYDYQLQQVDHVERTFREQNESWIEWTPSFGAIVSFDELELRYTGRITTGTGQPGIAPQWRLASPLADGASDFLVAPEGPLTLQEARVVTHQLAVRIPIR